MKLSLVRLYSGRNVFAMPILLLVSAWACIVPAAGASFRTRLAGVRECLGLMDGEDMEVQSLKQRYGKESFLVARPAGAPKPVAKAAIHATFESLFRGSGCHEDSTHPVSWFVDVGADDDEVLALASSVACGVFALDPRVDNARAVEMTRCMNAEPFRPFAVFQVNATDICDPSALNEILSQDGSQSQYHHRASLLGKRRPTMLNRVKQSSDDGIAVPEQVATEEKEGAVNAEVPVKAMPVEKVIGANVGGNAPKGSVTLDSLFMRSNSSGPISVMDSEGMSFAMDNIGVLKVTPRGEGDAPLKALHGAKELLESGRVKCLVTEMDFDLNTTEDLISVFSDLERVGFHFAHIGSLDYSELEITDSGSYPAFMTDSKQLQELFDTYKRIRSFDERSGFRVYSGSLSLDRSGNYFDYSDLIFACRDGFPSRFAVEAKGTIRFKNGVWWIEKR